MIYNIESVHNNVISFVERWLSSSEEMKEQLHELWLRLDAPTMREYTSAMSESIDDTYRATISTSYVLYLTLRPICILLGIVLQNVWAVVQEHGGKSLQHAVAQFKVAVVWFYKFQLSLTWKQIGAEIVVMASAVALWHFYKWLQRQSYWSRVMTYLEGKKRRLVESYTKFVHRVAQVSTVLALAMPHSVFLSICFGIRVMAPAFATWIVHDTILTDLLSVWYPLVCTLFLVTNRRHPSVTSVVADENDKASSKKDKEKTSPSSTSSESMKGTTGTDSTTKKADSINSSQLRRRIRTSVTDDGGNGSPKTQKTSGGGAKSNTPAEYSRAKVASKRNTNVPFSAPGRLGMSPQDSTTYWLRYWHVFGIVQAVGTFLSSIPIFGSFVMRHPLLILLTAELKTLFFVWLFGMEWMLPSSKESFLADALPLRLVYRFVTPILLKFYMTVSDALPQKLWQTWVVSKSETFLQAFVLIRVLSKERKDWIVHFLKESRGLLVPSITLFMPGFITQFGVAFVKYILPSAKSAQAGSDARRILYLQYWIMHCMLSAFLSVFSSVLWWIPFSTHGIFVLWCYLVLPHTIRVYYDIVEKDLAAFGLLKVSGNFSTDINDTTTVKLFSVVTSRLPTASSSSDVIESSTGITSSSDGGDITNVGKTDSNQKKKSDGDDAIPEFDSKTSLTTLSQEKADDKNDQHPAPKNVKHVQ